MAHVLAKDLREAVLQAAIQGKLTKQLKTDTPIKATLHDIEKEKQVLAKSNNKKQAKASIILEEEIPFDIPNEWEWVRWGMVATSIEYGASTKAMSSGNAKLVRITDVQNEKINWDSVPYCNVSNDILNRCLLREGDILFARTGGTVGKSVLVQGVPASQIPYIFAGYLIRTNCSQKLNISYLKYFMNSPLYWEQLIEKTIGSAQPNCNAKKLAHMIVPLPPIEEQARIVAKVDEIMAKIDEYEKLENQLVKLKEQFPQDMKDSLLQAGMMGNLTEQLRDDTPVNLNLIKQAKNKQLEESDIELPKNWSKSSIEGICESISSKKHQIKDSQVLKDGKYKVVSQSQQGVIGYSNSADKLFSHELPVITFGDHTTIVKLIDFDFVVGADGLKIFKPNCIVIPKYFYYSLEQLCNGLENVGGYTRHYKYIKNKPLPIPPIEEQQRIVDRLDELLPLVDKLAELN